jgi:hypothetical protein
VVAVGGAIAADGDITSAVLANRDVVLTGDAVVRVPQGTHTHTGVISGEGALRVSGTGTLVLAKDSTFTLPHSRQHQRVRIPGGNHPLTTWPTASSAPRARASRRGKERQGAAKTVDMDCSTVGICRCRV